jgi:hypothetical protein
MRVSAIEEPDVAPIYSQAQGQNLDRYGKIATLEQAASCS